MATAPISAAVRAGVAAARDLAWFYRHTPGGMIHFNDIIASSARGSWVTTTDGTKYLDMTSGIGVTSTGHCHPRVVEAVQKQAATVVHAQQNIFGAHEPAMALVDRLLAITPGHLSRFFFCNSGSEAVENAIKVARSATGRPNIIAFDGGFHGRTTGSMALSSSKTIYRQGFAPLMPGVFFAPYPYCLHCKTQEARGHSGYHVAPYVPPFDQPKNRACCGSSQEALKWMLKMQTAPQETAAIILEPILGEGGFLTPPPGFMAELRAFADAHGILLIADEVQSGAGRSGAWWAHTILDDGAMKPDIMVFAKGIASGYPMAGLATTDGLFDNMAPGVLGGTYGTNAVACAAAVATIDVITEEGILNNVAARSTQLFKGLMDIAGRFPAVIDVRGRGLMVGVEFGAPDGSSRAAPYGLAAAVTRAAARRHMLLMSAGARESVRFLPSLNISESEVSQGLEIFEASLADALAGVASSKATKP